MASENTIRAALLLFARNYGKHPAWATDRLVVFGPHLDARTDGEVQAGARTWITKHKTPPTLAQFLELIEADPRTQPPEEPTGCAACEDTGQREITKWTTRSSNTVVLNTIAACDCAKGIRLSQGAYADWRDVKRAWDEDQYVTRVYVSDAQTPKLPVWQRVDPETLDRLSVPADMQAPPGAWRQLVPREDP